MIEKIQKGMVQVGQFVRRPDPESVSGSVAFITASMRQGVKLFIEVNS